MKTYKAETEIRLGIPLKFKADSLKSAVRKVNDIQAVNLASIQKISRGKFAEVSARIIKIERAKNTGQRIDQRIDMLIREAAGKGVRGKKNLITAVAECDYIVRTNWGMALTFLDSLECNNEHEINLRRSVNDVRNHEYKTHVLDCFETVLEMVRDARDVDIGVYEEEKNIRIIFNQGMGDIVKKILEIVP